MATKVVYFTVDGKPEQAEFRSDDTADELKGNLEFTVNLFLVHMHCVNMINMSKVEREDVILYTHYIYMH